MERPAGRGLRGLRLARGDVLELVAVAVVFATGFSFLLRGIPDDVPQELLIIVGICLVAAAAWYVLRRRLGALREETAIRGFFIRDRETNAIIDVEGYEFASELARITRYATTEDAELRAEWDDRPIVPSPPADAGSVPAAGAARIIEECIEYLLLEELSMHLIDYFQASAMDEGRLMRLGREELADVVRGNRVLDLFSKPPGARGREAGAPLSDGGPVEIYFGDEYLYTRLDVRLPRGATVNRVPDGLEVDSPVVKVRLRSSFDGQHANLTSDFAELFLGDEEARLESFAVWVEVRTTVKRRALLLRESWDYFSWVDEFRGHLEESWNGEHFFERIRWPSIRALVRVIDRRSVVRSRTVPSRPADGPRPRATDRSGRGSRRSDPPVV